MESIRVAMNRELLILLPTIDFSDLSLTMEECRTLIVKAIKENILTVRGAC
jgi:hypothetical protein